MKLQQLNVNGSKLNQRVQFKGQILSDSDNIITVSVNLKSTVQQAYQKLLQEASYITSVNGIKTDQTGCFSLLGSGCISITDATDTTDSDTIAEQNSLAIFDGCKACNSCQDQWQLAKAMQQQHLWLIAMKDCQLYYEDAAASLWQQLLDNRLKDSQGLCINTQSSLDSQGYRQTQFKRAIKLLYQYKALIAMWNYMVYNMNNVVKVDRAPQDYAGLVARIKRSFNLCQDQHIDAMTLKITIQRQGAGQSQTGSIVDQVIGQQEPSQDAKKLDYKIYFYAGAVEQNTFTEFRTDSGNRNEANRGPKPTVTFQTVSMDKITATIQFTGLVACQATLSAEIKVIPIAIRTDVDGDKVLNKYKLTQSDFQNSGLSLTIGSFAKFRRINMTVPETELTATNRWKISSQWSTINPPLKDYTFYKTAYCAYPTRLLTQKKQVTQETT